MSENKHLSMDAESKPWSDDDVFVIGKGFKVTGDVMGDGLLVLNGEVQGNIKTTDLKINGTGFVSGTVQCDRIDANGRIAGSVQVRGAVLRSGAILDGGLTYHNLSMESGAIVDGEIRCTRVRPGSQVQADVVWVPFPPDVLQAAQQAGGISARLPNAQPLPDWIALEAMGLKVHEKPFKELQLANQPYFVALTVGSQSMLFDILAP